MSNLYNDNLLENLFLEGLELGLSDEQAEDYAWAKFEEMSV